MFTIDLQDLDDDDLRRLVDEHLDDMYATSPPESVHALGVTGLADPSVTVWSVREDGVLLACGALRDLGDDVAEIKAMRTARAARGRGAGTAMLGHLLAEARRRGSREVCLETGSQDFFEPARRMYRRHGFSDCGPFGSYVEDPHSVFMRLALT